MANLDRVFLGLIGVILVLNAGLLIATIVGNDIFVSQQSLFFIHLLLDINKTAPGQIHKGGRNIVRLHLAPVPKN